MSKLGCTCGHVIRDQTDNLPHKGEVLKHQDRDEFFEGAVDALAEYLAGVQAGDLAGWYARWPWLREKTDERVLRGLLGWHWRRVKVDVYECEGCGRLWVQAGTKSDQFVPFTPENPSAGRVLPSEHAVSRVTPSPVEHP